MSILSKEIAGFSKPLSTRRALIRSLAFNIMLFITVWFPFQNIIVSLWVRAGLPLEVSTIVVWGKEIMLLVILGLAVVGGAFRHWGKTELLILCFILLVLAYLPIGGLPLSSRLAGMRMLLWPFLMYLIGRSIHIPPNGLRRIWRVFIILFFWITVIGFLEMLFLPPSQLVELQYANYLAKGQEITGRLGEGVEGFFYAAIGSRFDVGSIFWARRMVSVYLDPLMLGHALVLPIIYLFYAFVSPPQQALLRPRWLVGVWLFILFLAQGLALSRGAILATLVGCGIILMSSYSDKTRLRVIILIGVVLIAVLAIPPTRDFMVHTIMLEDPSSGGHIRALEKGIRILSAYPMGLGLGQGGYVGVLMSGGAAQGAGESFFFSMTSQVGLIGAIIFILCLLAILRNLWNGWSKSDSIWLKVSSLVVFATLIGISISSTASEAAFGLIASGAIWFMSGMVVNLMQQLTRARILQKRTGHNVIYKF